MIRKKWKKYWIDQKKWILLIERSEKILNASSKKWKKLLNESEKSEKNIESEKSEKKKIYIYIWQINKKNEIINQSTKFKITQKMDNNAKW